MADRSKRRPDRFSLDEWPFFWMTQTVGRYLQALDGALKEGNLDVSRWRVLMCVDEGRISVGEIAELAIVKLPTMLKIVQRMQADGMVICESRPSDARYTDVALTQKGREARKFAWNAADDIYRRSFVDISAQERRLLNRLLRNVFEHLGGPPESRPHE